MSVRDWINERSDDVPMCVMDGYDDCIVGIVTRFGLDPIVCYDKEMVLEQLASESIHQDDDEDPETSALEWFEYNMIGAWVGDATPCFIERPPE